MMKVCVVSPGLEWEKVRLQPGCYIVKICQHLPDLGVEVLAVSDGHPRSPQADHIDGLQVHRLRHVRSLPAVGNDALQGVIELEDPDVVLWHIGLTSFYHLDLRHIKAKPVVGIFTSPIYTFREILRLGWAELLANPGWLYGHWGRLVPRALVTTFMRSGPFKAMIAQSSHAKHGLVRLGLSPHQVHVVGPGVDEEWLDYNPGEQSRREVRRQLGLQTSGFLILYLGSPERYRGIDTLLEALAIARETIPALKLQILSRGGDRPHRQEEARLRQMVTQLDLEQAVQMTSGFLAKGELVRLVASSDVVALPFKLVASGVPVSILEALALGKPVVSTSVDCIPELLQHGRGHFARPGDARDLARALLDAAGGHRPWQAQWEPTPPDVRGWRDAALEVADILEAHASSQSA